MILLKQCLSFKGRFVSVNDQDIYIHPTVKQSPRLKNKIFFQQLKQIYNMGQISVTTHGYGKKT